MLEHAHPSRVALHILVGEAEIFGKYRDNIQGIAEDGNANAFDAGLDAIEAFVLKAPDGGTLNEPDAACCTHASRPCTLTIKRNRI